MRLQVVSLNQASGIVLLSQFILLELAVQGALADIQFLCNQPPIAVMFHQKTGYVLRFQFMQRGSLSRR